MHFSIPDTQDLRDVGGSSYKAYNVHINGVLHCVVRYSQVYELNEQLKHQFGAPNVPSFPPKRFLQVKGIDLEERRLRLERYIQEISQNPKLASSELFVTFLCKAQQETQQEESIPLSFDVFLMNGHKISLDICSTDKTNEVLESIVCTLGLKPELTYYFGLFLMKKEKKCYSIIRKLQEFECPYISLKRLRERLMYKIVLRKAYWDQSIDDEVLSDAVGFKLLSVQAESDLSVGWTECSEETAKRLENLKSKGSNREHFQLCQSLTSYGYLKFNPCLVIFPKMKTTAVVSAGDYQIQFQYTTDDKKEKDEIFFVKRMKCWKMSSQYDRNRSSSSDHPLLELSFEYLFENGSLLWIAIVSEQAIMISMCIKSMVDELMRKRKGEKIKTPTNQVASGSKLSFKARDKSTEYLFHPSGLSNDQDSLSALQKAKDSMKKLTEKLSLVSLLPKSTDGLPATDNPTSGIGFVPPDISRNTFEGIGDEDL